MSDDPLSKIPEHDRVSIRAVVVGAGEDPNAALMQAGIYDPVAVPMLMGEESDFGGGILGDGITPNLTAVLEMDGDEGSDCSNGAQPATAQPQANATPASGTSTLPAAFGMRPLAPVWKRGP
jgi:hypothetical protein